MMNEELSKASSAPSPRYHIGERVWLMWVPCTIYELEVENVKHFEDEGWYYGLRGQHSLFPESSLFATCEEARQAIINSIRIERL